MEIKPNFFTKEAIETPLINTGQPAEQERPRKVTRFNKMVQTSEELTELTEAVKKAGGRIMNTTSLRAGTGISVMIELGERNKADLTGRP